MGRITVEKTSMDDTASDYKELESSKNNQSSSKPSNQFRDIIWSILFYLHFVPLIAFMIFGEGDASITRGFEVGGLIWVQISVSLVASGSAYFSLDTMMMHADGLVKSALVFSVGFSLLLGVLGLISGQVLLGLTGFASAIVGLCYARVVWNRIPYAAVNMETALVAVKENVGLLLVAHGVMAVAFLWSIFFFLGLGSALEAASMPLVFCWFVSFYWVHQVLQNTMHVIVAGVIGTWWYAPEENASTLFSPALKDSTYRALTLSFGSICFGSLLVAIVKAIRSTIELVKSNDQLSFLVCILECLLSCIAGLVEYLNKWAYIYVGLYGFNYIESAKAVTNLFQKKGWTVLVTDNLVDNVLFMISMGIALLCGVVGFVVGTASLQSGNSNAGFMSFCVGVMVGFLFASISMGMVGSAVDTVIVCYAEAPAELHRHHRKLADTMEAAWTETWPDLVFR